MYDDPVVTAKRILALSKDEPWAQKELAKLVPLLLEEIDRLGYRVSSITSWYDNGQPYPSNHNWGQ